MERIFASGMREFMKLREQRVADAGALLDGARRAMRASFQRELDTVESNLCFLASVGSVSPYVGLFGTVWGIMHAFVGLANLQQVTLATVAPGIAEALVATAIGLFAAIPAVMAYNRFARDIDRIAIQIETFIEEFSNILQRNTGAAGRPCMTRTPRVQTHADLDMAAVASAGSRRRTINEINMVPFIDVMLVLLIIFMVTAPLITTGMVDLPSVGKASGGPTSDRDHRRRDESLRMRVDGKDRAAHRLTELAARVSDAQARQRNTPVVISADRNGQVRAGREGDGQLQKAGVQRVGLSVKRGGLDAGMNAAPDPRRSACRARPAAGAQAVVLALLRARAAGRGAGLSVSWRTSEPAGVEAELWAAVPQVAAPRAVEPEPAPPKPMPTPHRHAPPPTPTPKVEPPPPPPRRAMPTSPARSASEKAQAEKQRSRRSSRRRGRGTKQQELAKAKPTARASRSSPRRKPTARRRSRPPRRRRRPRG